MNKQEFMKQLDTKFDNLIHSDAKKLLEYYSELIDDKIEDGINEDKVISSLGNIDLIAKKLIEELNLSKSKKNTNTTNNINNFYIDSLKTCEFKVSDIELINIKVNYSDIIVEESYDENIYIEYKSEYNELLCENKSIYITDVYNDSDSSVMFISGDKIKIKIPQNSNIDLKINSLSGDVSVIDIKNIKFISIHTINGDIEIENTMVTFKLNIISGSGDVLFKDNKVNTFNVDTSSGDVNLIDSSFDNLVKLKSSSGDISVNNCVYNDNVVVKVTSGDFVSQSMTINRNIDIKTVSGDGKVCVIGSYTDFNTGLKNITTSTVSGDMRIKFIN